MIKSITAVTHEIDDVETALREISDQIESGGGLLKNSAAVIMCHEGFVETGVVKAIGNAFDFPIAGCTTTIIATNEHAGNLMLSMLVYTSDDVEFGCGYTDPLNCGGFMERIREGCLKVASADKKIGLAMVFAPVIMENTPDDYVRALSGALPGVPFFGTLSVDDTLAYKNCFTICGGEIFKDRITLLFLYGENVKPKFYLATISMRRCLPNVGEITKARGNLLMEIDGGCALDFFTRIGFTYGGTISPGIQSIPLILDSHDESDPIIRVLLGLNGEGHGICGGEVPLNATMSIGVSEKNDVLEVTAGAVGKLVEDSVGVSAFMLSCIGRNMALGVERLSEAETVRSIMPPDFRFMMGHSGGEICPAVLRGRETVNRFHNYTFVACVI